SHRLSLRDCHHLSLTSFPTRRSSDLRRRLYRKVPPGRERQPRETVVPLVYTPLLRSAKKPPLLLTSFTGLQAFTSLEPVLCPFRDRKSTRLNSSHVSISYAVFCLKKK